MKEGWEYKKLGECFISINNGANIKQIKGAKGIPITRIETLSNDKFNRGRMGYADILDASPYSSYILNDGDILMSHINSMKYLGRAVQYLKKEDETIIHGMNLLRLVPTKDVLSSFLIYQFFTAFFRNQIVSISHQSVNQASFNTTNLKNLKLKVPPLSEQQSIVDYLDSAFAKIDAMKANAEKALNEVKALFQASLKEMLEPKEGWEEKTLGDICEIKSILVDPTEIQYKNLLHVGGANIVSETGELIDLKTAAEEELTSGKFTFNDKDVLYNKIRPYLIKVSRPDFSGLCSADMYPLTSKKGMTRDFLYYILVSRNFTEYAIMNSARAGMPKLNRQSLFAYKCMIPPLSEQQSIVATLDSLKSKVDRLQENYDKIPQECDALKQAILRQVFE